MKEFALRELECVCFLFVGGTITINHGKRFDSKVMILGKTGEDGDERAH